MNSLGLCDCLADSFAEPIASLGGCLLGLLFRYFQLRKDSAISPWRFPSHVILLTSYFVCAFNVVTELLDSRKSLIISIFVNRQNDLTDFEIVGVNYERVQHRAIS